MADAIVSSNGPGQLLSRGSDHVETFQNGQTLAMSLKHGKYFAMKGTAQRIWELLETPCTEADLTARLCAEYDISPSQCAADLRPFLSELLEFGLIVETPA
ncbi:PqqD family protein [Rhodobacteraceae bacterium NNCM2]|nr:PqqD family protein [Coraliihabitans acroporae]